MFQFQVHDVDCDFRLIKRHVFDKVVLTQNSGVIALELMTKVQLAGFRTVEVPVNHYHRAYGVSQFFRLSICSRWCSAWPSCGGGCGCRRGGDARSPARAAPGGVAPPGRRAGPGRHPAGHAGRSLSE